MVNSSYCFWGELRAYSPYSTPLWNIFGAVFGGFAGSEGRYLFHRIGWKGRIWQLWRGSQGRGSEHRSARGFGLSTSGIGRKARPNRWMLAIPHCLGPPLAPLLVACSNINNDHSKNRIVEILIIIIMIIVIVADDQQPLDEGLRPQARLQQQHRGPERAGRWLTIRPVHLVRVSLLRVLESNFPGDPLYNHMDMRIPTP